MKATNYEDMETIVAAESADAINTNYVYFLTTRNRYVTQIRHKSQIQPCEINITNNNPDAYLEFRNFSVYGVWCNGFFDAKIINEKFNVSFRRGRTLRTVEMDLAEDGYLTGFFPFWGTEESVLLEVESEDSVLKAKSIQVHFSELPNQLYIEISKTEVHLVYLLEWPRSFFPQSTQEVRPLFLIIEYNSQYGLDFVRLSSSVAKKVFSGTNRLKVALEPSQKLMVILVDEKNIPGKACYEKFNVSCRKLGMSGFVNLVLMLRVG